MRNDTLTAFEMDTLRDSIAQYRDLLNNTNQGFCVFEMVYDAAGSPLTIASSKQTRPLNAIPA